MQIHNNIYENVRTRVMVTHQNEMVLLAPISEENGWQLPGGGLEINESLADCGEREVFEETGLRVKVCGVAFLREFVVPKYCPIPEADRISFHLEVYLYTEPLPERLPLRIERPDAEAPHWVAFERIPSLPLWPKELKTLAAWMAAGNRPHLIPSFVSPLEDPRAPAPSIAGW